MSAADCSISEMSFPSRYAIHSKRVTVHAAAPLPQITRCGAG
jgi:hypothetical protein